MFLFSGLYITFFCFYPAFLILILRGKRLPRLYSRSSPFYLFAGIQVLIFFVSSVFPSPCLADVVLPPVSVLTIETSSSHHNSNKPKPGPDAALNRSRPSLTVTGTARPLKFDVYDKETARMERGFSYPALSTGRLSFQDPQDRFRWSEPTRPIHFKKGAPIATIVDPDLDARLAAERGRLVPLRSEYRTMLQLQKQNPQAISKLMLAIKEGEILQLETTILEQEIETSLRKTVVAPSDCEIIEGTRYSTNITPSYGNLFRYYPLSHIRFMLRLPLSDWGPDCEMNLKINGQAAQILRIYSSDLDETNEDWILSLEVRPAQSLNRMDEEFHYELTTTASQAKWLSRDIELHAPSCAIVGRRRTYPAIAPKIPGMLFFSQEENTWVYRNQQIGGVTLEGMDSLLQKINQYRASCDEFFSEAEASLIPSGSLAENDPRLIVLRQYYAELGRFLERMGAMTIEAKESGLLVGTLDYQGPLTPEAKNLRVCIKSPFVEIPDVRVRKAIDVKDGDIVFVELPSGRQKLGQVYKVVSQTLSPIQDISEMKLISVVVYDEQFHLGEAADENKHDGPNISPESGMPVNVLVPRYSNAADRKRIQLGLKTDFENAQAEPPLSDKPLYPIKFTFHNSSLSPLEKMAYMRQANASLGQKPSGSREYTERLTAAIIEEQDPEIRWVAFQKLIDLKFTEGFAPLIHIAVRGPPDIASAALFHLNEKQRYFELLDILNQLQDHREDRDDAVKKEKEPLLSLTYQLLRGMIDYPNTHSDALTHLMRRGRLDPVFQKRLYDFLFSVIRTEGVNAPASIRILRGEDVTGQPLFPEIDLKAAMHLAERGADQYLCRVFQRELDRRELMGISRNTKYGYGATFIETGFLYLRDLEKIDLLVRSRENYLHDLRFLESSPRWTEIFPLNPEVLSRFRSEKARPRPIPQPDTEGRWANRFPGFHKDIQFAAFRKLTKLERSLLIKNLGTKRDYNTLVLMLRDPQIRHQHAGDILDWLFLAPGARLELARYYAQCNDAELLNAIDHRQYVAEVLPDIDNTIRQLEDISVLPRDAVEPTNVSVISPAPIHIYQTLLLRFWERAPNEDTRFNYLVTWVGLLPSGFELKEDQASLYERLWDRGITWAQFESAVQYVRERRSLKHAVAREREKRAENRQVEIHPGFEETILRQVSQEVEAGMPPRRHPLALLEEKLENSTVGKSPNAAILSLKDTLRLAKIRNREFAKGIRERLSFEDIAGYAIQICLAPLYILVLVPLIWLANIVLLLFEAIGLHRTRSRKSLDSSLRRAERLLKSTEAPGPLKREIVQWINILQGDKVNLDQLILLQEKVKRIMNYRDIVYHLSTDANGRKDEPDEEDNGHRQDPLNPEFSIKLAPCLTLLALLTRLTAEHIWYDVRRETEKNKRMYFLMEWFLQRSAYFSGYRYTLNPLANYHIAESYIWRDIPSIGWEGQSAIVKGLLIPVNLFISALNLFGQIFLSLPMRFLYLFGPISFLGASVFKRSLRRLVIDVGNRLEENLYPDPEGLMKQTSERLRTGWTHRMAEPDQPGGRFLFTYRRIATRVLPFAIIATIVSGGFPYIYELLTGQGWAAPWNLRSTGIFAAYATVVILALTMALHWLPLLMGWIPFAHLRNQIRIHRSRVNARKSLLGRVDRKRIRSGIQADDELQMLNFADAFKHLKEAKNSDAPILDLLILLVENPAFLSRYRDLATSLLNKKTVVLAYPTCESMDGGGARLSTLKIVNENYEAIREQHPHLPRRFDQTRSCFMPIGSDCDPQTELPVNISALNTDPGDTCVPLTSFVLAVANVQSFMKHSFVYNNNGDSRQFVGSITISPQRMYVGPTDVDQGGRFRGGATLIGAFESIETVGQQGALVVLKNHAFIQNSADQLRNIIRKIPDLQCWMDAENTKKRQLPVAQLAIERFRTPERYRRHIQICIRYIDEIQRIKDELLEKGPRGERDVSDEDFLSDIAIHYMRHLIVPWLIAYRGESLENYRSDVLTGEMSVLDRRRTFHKRVLELIELFQEEGQAARRQLPKVRFVNAPTAKIYYAKTSRDLEPLRKDPHMLFPTALTASRSESEDSSESV